MSIYKKNLKLLTKNHVYSKEMEHDSCGVGLIASTEGKKSRAVVEYGIEALKAVWHRGAVDADGKTGDGAGIHVEIPKDFFIEKIEVTGHDYDNSEICVGMIFLPRNDYSSQENCKTIVESELTKNNFSIYGWRQVPVNPKVLGAKALQTMPEIIELRDLNEEDPTEIEASKHDLAYIKLDGSIGCMVNGAGLAMATMDIIKLYGKEPANFLDVGGGASKEKVSAALKIILSDINVKGILINIFGGIMRCDVLAQGVVDAAKEINISVPLVVRLAGTNFKEGKEILDNSGLKLISAENLDDAAKKIVEAIK